MAKLTEPIKIAIVQGLACFDTPTQVAEAIKEEFGVVLSRQQVGSYDPTKPNNASKGIAKKLRALFEETRKQFLESAAEIPIAQQSYRLRALQRNFQKADAKGNIAMAAQLLEQAAKEAGGAFTNRRELTGKGGSPLTVLLEQLGGAALPVSHE